MQDISTPLCRSVGIAVPVVQAPIGSATTPQLVAAVGNAGALGTLALTWSDDVDSVVTRTRALSDRPFGVNFVLAFPIEEKLARCLALGVRIVSTAWGDPGLVHSSIAEAGAIHLHTVGSVSEAKRAVDAGVDVIVAQGWEAGGHVRGTAATLSLVPAVVDAVAPRPVIAAGGIGDGRGVAAALVLGAQAAWLGTRFLAAEEANTHDRYRSLVIAADGQDAAYTVCFDGGWPDAPHRALRNSTLDRWEAAGRPAAPDRPGEGDVVAVDAAGRQHRRYRDVIPLRGMEGDVEALALYAGQSVGLVRDVMPAAAIVERLRAETRAAVTSVGRAE